MSGNNDRVIVKVTSGEVENNYDFEKGVAINLTSTIDGSNSRNRCGRWMEILENGRVSLSTTKKTPGGQLLRGYTVWQEFNDGGKSHRTTVYGDTSSRYTITKEIPVDGELIVRKPLQEWRFKFSS